MHRQDHPLPPFCYPIRESARIVHAEHTKIVKEEKKEGENIVDTIEKQANDIQVLQKRKPKKINFLFG